MGRRVPPFAAIRAFEAAARHGTLQAAADELGVSPSAVSHQIKSLEDFLGAKVFVRRNNKLSLTDLGTSYQQDLRQALDLIEIATARAAQRQKGGRITVNLFFSLAELWLVPLLGSFHEAHPDIEVKLVTQPEDVSLSGSDIDVAIRYASRESVEQGCEFLFEEDILPVCSPGFLVAMGPMTSPADLTMRRLIISSLEPSEWSIWAGANGVSLGEVTSWLELDQRTFVMQAARKGLGVAMARRPYADTDLEEGTLIAPFPKSVKTGFAYYLVVPERSRNLPRVKAFSKWLLEHCQVEMSANLSTADRSVTNRPVTNTSVAE